MAMALIKEGVDSLYGDIGGRCLVDVPTPRGYCMEVSVQSGWFGLMRLQALRYAGAPAVVDIVRTPPGLSSSSGSEEGGIASRELTAHERHLLAQWSTRNRRLRMLPVHASTAPVIDIEATGSGMLHDVASDDSASASAATVSSECPSVEIPDADVADPAAQSLIQIHATVRRADAPAQVRVAHTDLGIGDSCLVLTIDGPLHIQCTTQSTFSDVSLQLARLGRIEEAQQLIPVYPALAQGPAFLLRPCGALGVTVAVRNPFPPFLHHLTLATPAVAKAVTDLCLGGDLWFMGRPLSGCAELFDGMVLDTKCRIATVAPRETRPVTLQPGSSQSEAREPDVLLAAAGSLSDRGPPSDVQAVSSLESLIPAHMARPHNAGVCHDMLSHCTEGFDLSDLRCDLPLDTAAPWASHALVQHLPVWPSDQTPQRLLLYTDGSFGASRQVASWAVAVFVDHSDHAWHWAGFAAGSVPCSGPYAAPSAFEAELFAFAAAMLISLRAGSPAIICVYDSQSAAAVASCIASTNADHPLAAATRSLYLACVAAGIDFTFMHTYSHRGDPGNELVDALADYCHSRPAMTLACQELCSRLSWPEIHWLWLPASARHDVPLPGEDGHTPSMQVALPDRRGLSTPARLAGLPDDAASGFHSVALRFATYNTLSRRSHLQQQALATLFHRQGRQVIGLQETRVDAEGVKAYGPYTAFCSPGVGGTEGVQLWIDFACPVTDPQSDDQLRFVRETFCIRHATPRLLLVTGCLGDFRLLFVVGHALTSTHTADEIAQWWQTLDFEMRRIPRGFCPVLLLDANARFRAAPADSSASAAHPENANAEALLSLARSHRVHLSGLRDADGCAIVSWTSPSGHSACLDFLGVPDVWSGQMRTRAAPSSFCDQFAGIDHHPVYLDIDMRLAARIRKTHRLPNVRTMRSPAGQSRLRAIWRTVPQVPWHVDVDSHLAILNRHLQNGLLAGFADQPQVSNPAISDDTWELLRLQRGLRRRLFRVKGYMQRDFTAAVFYAWRHAFSAAQCAGHHCRQHRGRMQLAVIARALQNCRQLCRARSRLDQAAFTRAMFQSARSREELPHLLRCVLRTGRRYRAPQLVPVMETSPGIVCSTRDDFLLHAGRHFAQAERARTSSLPELPALYPGHDAAAVLDLCQLPTLEDLTRAFARLKPGRAPGITGLTLKCTRAALTWRPCRIGPWH